MHIALCASIYRFLNDELHFEAEIVDPQKLAQVASLSRHSSVSFSGIMSRHSLKISRNSSLKLSCNFRDMSVLCFDISLVPFSSNTQMVCCDIKALLRQSFLLASLDCVTT